MSTTTPNRWPSDLESRIAEALLSAGLLGPQVDRIEVRRLLNWGGFVNASFRVSDADRVLHVKLADDDLSAACLERWFILRDTLHERYAAPRVIHWLELAGPLRGLVSEWIEGSTPDWISSGVRDQAVGVLSRLHSDSSIAARLAAMESTPSKSCADHYRDTYHERFVEDLKEIGQRKPPFISDERFEWMERAASELHSQVSALAAFGEPADAPVHGDPWINNLIVEPGGRLWVIDWDDIELGDPMIDWGMLFGPTPTALSAFDSSVFAELPVTSTEQARLHVYARASLLDWVIDPLADWIEADSQPEVTSRVREAKERVHQEAFALYAARYP